MAKTTRILCYLMIVTAVAWSLLAIGNGKVGAFFGTEIFIAAKRDMMVALVLNGVAAVGLLTLGLMAAFGRKA